MYFKSQVASVVAKIFSLPPIIAGCFLIAKIPEGFAWGIFSVIFGLALWGFKYTIRIEKKYLKTTISIYSLGLRSKTHKISEFSSIHLGIINSISINQTASGEPSFDIVFVYKNPNNYMTGNLSVIKGFDINAFTKVNTRNLDNSNFISISKTILKNISELTGLPITYSDHVAEIYEDEIKNSENL